MSVHPELIPDDFFTRSGTPCDRCSEPLKAYTLSWFTYDVICMDCSSKEKKLKEFMRNNNVDPRNFEGCGYVPNLMGKKENNG